MYHYDVLLAYVIMLIVGVIVLCLAADAYAAHMKGRETPTTDDYNTEDDLPDWRA